jgi:hypothetical protein
MKIKRGFLVEINTDNNNTSWYPIISDSLCYSITDKEISKRSDKTKLTKILGL